MVFPAPASNIDLIRDAIIEMNEAIARTRRDIAAIKPANEGESQLISATDELDTIIEATEMATSNILEAAEDVQDIA